MANVLRKVRAPNLNPFLYRVETGLGIQMLHRMNPVKTNRVIVPTLQPRPKISDLIRAYTPAIGYVRLSDAF